METHASLLLCPVCGAGLAQAGKTLQCPSSHSFDIAREGYVNLLLRDRKSSRLLGDKREMLEARRRFLSRDFYRPLSDAINEQIDHYLARTSKPEEKPSPVCILEVGCGEGYYLARLKRYLDRLSEPGSREKIGDSQPRLAGGTGSTRPARRAGGSPPVFSQLPGRFHYFGMDISKEAVRLAAKQYQGIGFFVADVKRKILMADHSVAVLLNLFAPRDAAEFDRVVAKQGLLLIVIPSPRHLANLRLELGLLAIEENKRQRIMENFAGAFTLVNERAIEYEIELSSAELRDLIQMTPNYWHGVPNERWSGLEGRQPIETTASFTILELGR